MIIKYFKIWRKILINFLYIAFFFLSIFLASQSSISKWETTDGIICEEKFLKISGRCLWIFSSSLIAFVCV